MNKLIVYGIVALISFYCIYWIFINVFLSDIVPMVMILALFSVAYLWYKIVIQQ